jgi:Tol biopolymer transport system component
MAAMRSDGSHRRVVASGYFETPDLSPDGTWLVALHGVEHGLATVDSQSGSLTVIADGRWQSPRISPDGRRIAAVRSVEAAGFELVLMDRDGSDQQVLRPPGTWAGPSQVEWSPDGGRLALTDGSGMALALYDLAAGTTQPIRPRPGVVSYPRWSPDGSRIAFTNGKDIIVIPSGGGPDRIVTGDTDEWPNVLTWEGPGHLLFGAGSTLFRVSAEGGRAAPVAEGSDPAA